jgi:HlyD family secretion protein
MKRLLRVLVLLAAAGGAAYWYLSIRNKADTVTAFQGYVEGNLVFMAPEEGGRIERLAVEAGDAVTEGQLLFALEASVQEAQRHEAEARLRQAEAQLANLAAAQQRPEQIAILQAARERAVAALDYARTEFERQQTLYLRGYSAKARLDQAEAAFERDKAALAEVDRQIEAARLAGRSGEIAAAEAAMRAAEAALRQAESHIAKRRVAAPAASRVQDVFFRAGEVVNAGQPVLALLPPANLRLRFYVPEPLLSTLALGQTVAITCDRCPAALTARITFLSSEAEYTPPVIFSEQERAKLVFRAEAKPVSELNLPIGLPVAVTPASAGAVASQSPSQSP